MLHLWNQEVTKEVLWSLQQQQEERAWQLSKSCMGEGELSQIQVAVTNTSVWKEGATSPTSVLVPTVEGRTLTSPGVEVGSSLTPGSAMCLGEAQPLRTEPPASFCPSSRSIAGSSARRGGATSRESQTAIAQKLLLSDGSLSLAGEICTPNIDRDCELLGNCIVSLSALRAAFGCTHYPECESPSCLVENVSVHRGLVTLLTVKCTQCTWLMCKE